MNDIHKKEEKLKAFGEMLDVLDTLREKCPWDRKQTNESLRPNTVEEVYELVDALIAEDDANICKELGDVLLHVAFYAKIGEEKGVFDIVDVCDRLVAKLKFRHPHIYGDVKADTADQVIENWEKLKLKEKDGNRTVLGGVPSALPAMIKGVMSVLTGKSVRKYGIRYGKNSENLSRKSRTGPVLRSKRSSATFSLR